MSYTVTFNHTVTCDAPGCPEKRTAPEVDTTESAFTDSYEELGWVIAVEIQLSYCPTHATQGEQYIEEKREEARVEAGAQDMESDELSKEYISSFDRSALISLVEHEGLDVDPTHFTTDKDGYNSDKAGLDAFLEAVLAQYFPRPSGQVDKQDPGSGSDKDITTEDTIRNMNRGELTAFVKSNKSRFIVDDYFRNTNRDDNDSLNAAKDDVIGICFPPEEEGDEDSKAADSVDADAADDNKE